MPLGVDIAKVHNANSIMVIFIHFFLIRTPKTIFKNNSQLSIQFTLWSNNNIFLEVLKKAVKYK